MATVRALNCRLLLLQTHAFKSIRPFCLSSRPLQLRFQGIHTSQNPILSSSVSKKPTSNIRTVGIRQLSNNRSSDSAETEKDNAGFLSLVPRWFKIIFLPVVTFWSRHKTDIKKAEEEAEEVLEIVEEVAEQVEKVADVTEEVSKKLEDILPEGSTINEVAQTVENVSEGVSQDAHAVEAFVEKVSSAKKVIQNAVEELEELTRHGSDQKHESKSKDSKL